MYFILALALITRLVFLNQSLWLDESIQALALMGKMGPLLQYALADYQPPLYHLIGYGVTHLLGYSEIVLRLPSLLAGLLTVYFVMKIGMLLGNKRIGYIAGLLTATNPLLIYYAQEGRTYALTTFLVTASFYYLFLCLKNKTRLNYALYALFTVLFLWTSYLAWFVFVAQVGYVLYQRRFDIFRLQIVAGLTLFAWLPSFISSLGIGQSTKEMSPEWGRVVGGLNWKSLPLTWVKFAIGRISFENKLLYAALVSLLALLHLYILKNLSFKKHSLFALWITLPLVCGLITATILPVYQYFRVLFVLPAYLLLLAFGLAQAKSKQTLLLSLLILAQFACLVFFWFSPQYHREDWRTLAQDLKNDPTAAVAMPSRAQDAPLRYYNIPQSIIEPAHEPVTGNKVYYIRYVEDLFDTAKLGQANLSKAGYTNTSQRSYPGIAVDVYEMKGSGN